MALGVSTSDVFREFVAGHLFYDNNAGVRGPVCYDHYYAFQDAKGSAVTVDNGWRPGPNITVGAGVKFSENYGDDERVSVVGGVPSSRQANMGLDNKLRWTGRTGPLKSSSLVGYQSRCAIFDGTSGAYIDNNNVILSDVVESTSYYFMWVSFWLWVEPPGGVEQQICAFGQNVSNHSPLIGINTANKLYFAARSGGTTAPEVTNDYSAQIVYSANPLPFRQWIHVVCAVYFYNGGTGWARIFLNGALDNARVNVDTTNSYYNYTATPTARSSFGCKNDNGVRSRFFKGRLAHFFWGHHNSDTNYAARGWPYFSDPVLWGSWYQTAFGELPQRYPQRVRQTLFSPQNFRI